MMDIKKLLKFLFPEYQLFVLHKERLKQVQSPSRKQTYQGGSFSNSTTQQGSVSPDFGKKSAQTSNPKTTVSTITDSFHQDQKNNYAKVRGIFDTLPNTLKNYWIGSEKDLIQLRMAFERPYLSGIDGIKPKNSVLILGGESRGRVYAVRCIADILCRKSVFKSGEVPVIALADYAGQVDDSLFLSDLYSALCNKSECIVIDDVDRLTASQQAILFALMAEGIYKMNRRYVNNNGALQDATGLLNASLVSEISAQGKFFILSSAHSKNKVFGVLGYKMVETLGDIIELSPIEKNQLHDLAKSLMLSFVAKCKQQLKLNVLIDDSVSLAVGQEYCPEKGVKGLVKYAEDNLYKPLVEMLLQGFVAENSDIRLFHKDEFWIEVKDGRKTPLSIFVKNFSAEELIEVKKELDDIVGLSRVKEYVKGLEDNVKIQKMRSLQGFKKADVSKHMIFVGNPGTGKTTIARIVAQYLKAIGVLSTGQLREVSRVDLVGQYVGQTAQKMQQAIESALGGVLFIDEAYSLCRDNNDIFGVEAIDTLVKGMEDFRDNLVVILAGYEDEMNKFLESNPGLKSRFPNIVHFDDYTEKELLEITKITVKSKGYRLSEECEDGLLHLFEKSQIKGKNDSGNGRLVRNVVEAAIINQSKRLARGTEVSDLDLLKNEDFGFQKHVDFDLEKELANVVGLESVKNFVRTQYTVLQADRKRRCENIKVDTSQSLNMIFAGNPGTGKTTVARIVASMLRSMDLLKSGQLVEADKGSLVASYAGATAKRTEDVFKSALGGVLFVDEAYAIANDKAYGQECIDTLVKLIEDYRGEIVVILAGYDKEMKDFLKQNSGLESRFPLRIDFPDYSAKELYEIGCLMIKARGFSMSDSAESVFAEELVEKSRSSSGNGRMVRNFVEEIIRRQSVRIAKSSFAGEALSTILPEDVREVADKSFDLESELSKVVGLESVKRYIRALNARLKVQAARRAAGLKVDKTQTMHMIFAGNPGTGKTMMARTIANVLFSMGVIRTNKLVETDRSRLVAGYVGQTAIKTREVIESALNGVLFIDEAYALAQGGPNDFGQECIDTLVKMMDDNRDRLVVILAGYQDDMNGFLQKNAGLRSRFANIIEFEDYSVEDLLKIAGGLYAEQGYLLTDEAREALTAKFTEAKKSTHFGNGRFVRNVFERSLNYQALRLSSENLYGKDDLVKIIRADIVGG